MELRCVSALEAVSSNLAMQGVMDTGDHIRSGNLTRITSQQLWPMLTTEVLHDRLRL